VKRFIASTLLFCMFFAVLPSFGAESQPRCACCRNERTCHCCNHKKSSSEPSLEDGRSGCGKECACSFHPNSSAIGSDKGTSVALTACANSDFLGADSRIGSAAYLTVSGRAPPLS